MAGSGQPQAAGYRGLVIFDCDGVLVDSEILACDVQSRALARHGMEMSGAEVARRFLGASAKDMRAAIETDLGRPLPADHEEQCQRELFLAFRRELVPIVGIAGVIRAVRGAGYACCVASSSSPERIALALDVTGLRSDLEPHIFSSTMVSRGKPAPDLFLFAARRMGFEPGQAQVVEDSPNGVRAAKAAHMRCLGFVGGSHCSADHAAGLLAVGADRICVDAQALSAALIGRDQRASDAAGSPG